MKRLIFLVSVFLVALSLRALFIVSYDSRMFLKQEFTGGDEGMYDAVAANIQAGHGLKLDNYYQARVSPVYPVFLAAVYSLAGHDIVLVRFLQALIGSLTTLVIFFLAELLFNEKTARIACVLSAVYYPFIQMPAYLMTEVLYTFLLSVTLLLSLLVVRKPGVLNACAAGACYSLTVLCRGTLLGFIVLFAVGLYAAFSVRPAERIAYIMIVIAAVMIMLFPWVYRNYQIFRGVIPGTNVSGYLLYMGNSPGATGGSGGFHARGVDFFDVSIPPGLNEYEKDRYLKREAVAFIKENPKRAAELALLKFWNMWRPYHAGTRPVSKVIMCCSYVPIVVFACIGVLFSLRDWRRYLLFYLLFAFYIGVHMVLIGIIRYRYPVEPLLIMFCAYGVTELWRRYRAQASSRCAVPV